MALPASLSSAAVAALLLVASSQTAAFSPYTSQGLNLYQPYTSNQNVPFVRPSLLQSRRSIIVSMAEESEDKDAEDKEAEAVEETDAEGNDSEEETEEEPKEDPEITALKEEIASLESELKAKRVELSKTQDLADDYTEKGYQRKCADMENMRRMRSAASSSSVAIAKANVIQSFLSNLDYLNYIDEFLADNEFAKSYKALKNDFEGTLKSMDLAELTVEVGSKMDTRFCKVVGEEVSEDGEAGVILRVEKGGYEVAGNVIRLAEVVVSVAKEEPKEEEKEAEEESKETEEEKKED